LIALSDQDDVWLPEKLARTESLFATRPEVGAVFTDAEMVDELATVAAAAVVYNWIR